MFRAVGTRHSRTDRSGVLYSHSKPRSGSLIERVEVRSESINLLGAINDLWVLLSGSSCPSLGPTRGAGVTSVNLRPGSFISKNGRGKAERARITSGTMRPVAGEIG